VKRVIYPGTFDPITNGHIDIIQRATTIFDRVVIAVAESREKKPMFSLSKRVDMVSKAVRNLDSVEVRPFSGLLVHLLEEENTNFVIRGLRNGVDFEYEKNMEYANRSLYSDIETIYLNCRAENSFISSSVVRTLLKHGGDISHLVPDEVEKIIRDV